MPSLTITTTHPAASPPGRPVVLSDSGAVLPDADAVRVIRRALGLSQAGLAERVAVSRRTVEGWELGRPVPGPVLLLLGRLLEEAGAKADDC